jgi:signal transduction histidine kinase
MAFSNTLRGTRRLLTLGFGALLVLIAVAGAYALVVLSNERSAETRVRDAYLRRDSLIEQIRSGIYSSGTIVRDYLLASPDTDIHAGMALWQRVRARTDQVIQDYSAQADKRDFALFKVLSSDLASYWALQQSVLERPMTQKDGPFYSGEMRQRRRETLAVADRLNTLHAQELLADDAELKANFQEARFRLLVVVSACLLFGIGLAGYTIRRTLQLEAELEARYAEGVRARQEAQELSARLLSAQEQERRAISRELHDEVGQSLSALLMEAGHAAARVKDHQGEVGRHVDSIKRLAESSVQVIRNMTLLLRPSMLDDFGLVPALEWQAREVSKRTGLLVLVAAEESASELPEEQTTCIYRVVQEALHNCARHSKARRVNVEVRKKDSAVFVLVEDDGDGFDARRVRGLGLAGMAERVHHLGGEFRVNSRPGSGTQIEVELPLVARVV